LAIFLPEAYSAGANKERLVLMPLRVSEADKGLQGAMETALVEGLQQEYEVFSGEQVAQKAREIFMKESRTTTKKDCDETRCMQGIAEAFQAELIATTSVTKRSDGYFLALSIRNIFDNKVVYSKSLPCEGCNVYQVVSRLKELSTKDHTASASKDNNEATLSALATDPDSALWTEVQRSNSMDDYEVYIAQYPKGKYVALAKSRIKKLKSQAAAELAKREKAAWDNASDTSTEASYQTYISEYPKGKYVALAKSRIKKLQKEAATEAGRRDQQAWQAANKSGGITGLNGYLRSYPQGRYVDLAKERIRKLQTEQSLKEEQSVWDKVKDSEDPKALQSYLDKYPVGSHADTARKKLPILEENALWKSSLKTATRASMQAYIQKYPDGRYSAQARQLDEQYQRIPPRPKIPFKLSEEIWRKLETSEAYLNAPKPRGYKVRYKGTVHTEFTGSKSSSLRTPKDRQIESIVESTPIGDRCSAVSNSQTNMTVFVCAEIIPLGSNNYNVQKIDELKGSLFPMRIGAKYSLRQQSGDTTKKLGGMSRNSSCEVTNVVQAKEVDTSLSGKAWKIHCKTEMDFANMKTILTETDDYYFEDLGLFLSQIGQLDSSTHKFILPKPGSQTAIVTDGEYGSRVTTTYTSYDWSVEK